MTRRAMWNVEWGMGNGDFWFRETIHIPKSPFHIGSRGQVTLEYFILFAVLAAVTLVSVTTFDDAIRSALGTFFNAAANNIAK